MLQLGAIKMQIWLVFSVQSYLFMCLQHKSHKNNAYHKLAPDLITSLARSFSFDSILANCAKHSPLFHIGHDFYIKMGLPKIYHTLIGKYP